MLAVQTNAIHTPQLPYHEYGSKVATELPRLLRFPCKNPYLVMAINNLL